MNDNFAIYELPTYLFKLDIRGCRIIPWNYLLKTWIIQKGKLQIDRRCKYRMKKRIAKSNYDIQNNRNLNDLFVEDRLNSYSKVYYEKRLEAIEREELNTKPFKPKINKVSERIVAQKTVIAY